MAELTVGRSQARYRAATDQLAHWPLWHQPWWLDAVGGQDGWDVLIAESGGAIHAALPFVQTRKVGRTLWTQPILTQGLGPVLEDLEGSHHRRASREVALLGALADAIPSGVTYRQSWLPTRTNWLPFYWRGFRQTTRYTLRVDLGRTPADLRGAATTACRGAARKAQSRLGVEVFELRSLEDFLAQNRNVFQRKGMERPFAPTVVERIHRTAADLGRLEMLQAVDGEGRIHAAGLFVWDSTVCYYLLGGTDPDLRNSGAMNLLIFEAFGRAADRGLTTFDFEGSMIEPIEFFFRSFGAAQVPYFAVMGPADTMLGRVLSLRG